MKRFLLVAAMAATALPALAADVGVSISIGQPGFYGRIDIGDYPTPQLLYRRPMVIERGAMDGPPIYLRVPPGHAKNWRKHCHEYNACREQVYFVQDRWYQKQYVPRYQERQRDERRQHGDERRNEQGPVHGRQDQPHQDKGRKDQGPQNKGHQDQGRPEQQDRKNDDHGRGH